MTTIANSVWVATALLHRSNPHAVDFSVGEIVEKTTREGLIDGFRPGLQVHVSKHCVANKSPNSERHRMLFGTTRGRRRLFRNGDPFDVDRTQGKVRPEKRDLPPDYQPLVDWYDAVYSKQTLPPAAELISETASGSETAFVSSAGAFVIPGHLRKELGISEGTRLSIHRERDRLVLRPITDELIRSLRGRYKGTPLVEDRESEHRVEKDRLTR
ncbi:MAG TPA: AbrB/MazE/SpoVT family DNA-binding domain-containing protein [Terriglobales bacterium]|nr:AbrB/MazE/SpoVT family DNA-binding domain-containing protein [Terriglobales bacterium]